MVGTGQGLTKSRTGRLAIDPADDLSAALDAAHQPDPPAIRAAAIAAVGADGNVIKAVAINVACRRDGAAESLASLRVMVGVLGDDAAIRAGEDQNSSGVSPSIDTRMGRAGSHVVAAIAIRIADACHRCAQRITGATISAEHKRRALACKAVQGHVA